MKSDLGGQVALLVGAGAPGDVASNGRAIALELAGAGATVALLDKSDAALDACATAITDAGGSCTSHVADVADEAGTQRAIEEVFKRHGRVDVLVFNVGIPHFGKLPAIRREDYERVFAINVFSAMSIARHVLPSMDSRQRGVFTFISSVSSVRHLGISSPLYDTSKASLAALSRHIAVQYAAKGIRSNLLVLGMLDTPLARNAIANAGKDIDAVYEKYNGGIPAKRLGKAEEVAAAALFLSSDAASYINGSELVVDGGLIARAG